MRRKLIICFAVLGILLLSVIAYHGFKVPTKKLFFSLFPIFTWTYVEEPVLFNHIHHKEVPKLNCTFCHLYVQEHRAAGIPNIELCKACHATDAISKRPQALKVVGYVQAGKRIPWKRMYELPAFVVFPHWVHIRGNVDCSTCHGLTGTSDRPSKMVSSYRNYMEWCIACHEKRGVSTDCYTCHSS